VRIKQGLISQPTLLQGKAAAQNFMSLQSIDSALSIDRSLSYCRLECRSHFRFALSDLQVVGFTSDMVFSAVKVWLSADFRTRPTW
jgi:hypothetical protein